MNTVIALALTAAWLALGVLLAWHVLDAWWRPEPLPIFKVLKRYGLSVTQAEKAAGPEAFAAAQRRCASCGDRKACARVLAVDWLGHGPVACSPNAGFFRQLKPGAAQRA